MTGVRTTHKPDKIIDLKGKKQVNGITSAERGELVTIVCGANALGNVILPTFIYSGKRLSNSFLRCVSPNAVAAVSDSGWIKESVWVDCLKHFVQKTKCAKEHPVLLIIDNHESHITLEAVEFARENGIVIYTYVLPAFLP